VQTCDEIKDTLQALRIPQAEVARAAGRSEATISRQLNGLFSLSPEVQSAAGEIVRAALQHWHDTAARLIPANIADA